MYVSAGFGVGVGCGSGGVMADDLEGRADVQRHVLRQVILNELAVAVTSC